MELQHSFTVPAPIAQAWSALLDVEQVAACMPGATLDRYDGEAFTGTVKVKIGAIAFAYGGRGRFIERDLTDHRVVIEAAGRERRGGGNASAQVTCRLTAQADDTLVTVRTDLTITGKPAQFGRGAIADIGAKIIDQFAGNLAAQMSARTAPSASGTAGPDRLAPSDPSTDAIDLVALAGPVVAKRAALTLVAVAAAVLAVVVLRRR